MEGQVGAEDIHSQEENGPSGDGPCCEKEIIYSDEGALGREEEGCSVTLALGDDPHLLKLASHPMPHPVEPGLIADIEHGHYFETEMSAVAD